MELEGEFIRHVACVLCDSSDALAVYKQKTNDGSDCYTGYCFSCQNYVPPKLLLDFNPEDTETPMLQDFSEIEALECRGWRERRVGLPVSKMYGVRTEFDNNGKVLKRFYPVTHSGNVGGWHVRDCAEKNFYTLGKNKVSSEFFGQSLFPAGGKFLVITGGEEDAMSLQQALKDKNPKYNTAVVSPTNGEGSTAKQIKANYEWVTSFEKVILMLDNDKAGKEATEDALRLLKPGQGYVAKLNLKDPNEYLVARREEELIGAFWKAERYSPIEIMTLGQMWDDFEQSANQSVIPFPAEFSQLNDMLGGGVALGEVTVIGALTSIGKSTIINNLVYSFFKETEHKIGLLYLESTPREIVSNLLSIHIEENLALQKPSTLDMVKLKKEFMRMVSRDDRIVSVNHQGAFASMDELFSKVEWMAKAMGTKVIIIDPVQCAVPSNENSQIDEFMDAVLKLAKQTDATIFVVSHMRKPEGKDPHAVSEYELKGPLDGETEFLSPNGWVKMKDWSGHRIAAWNNGEMQFEEPLDYIKQESDTMLHIHNKKTVDMIVSPNHRVPFYDKNGDFNVLAAEEFVKQSRARIPTTFNVDNAGLDLTDDEIRAMVMIAADGCDLKTRPGNVQMEVSKTRKRDRIREILNRLDHYYWENDTGHSTVFRFKQLTECKDLDKCANWYMANSHQLSVLLDECFLWDGHDSKGNQGRYFSTVKEREADVIQFAAHACGYRAGKNFYSYPDKEKSSDHYQVYVSRKDSAKGRVFYRKDTVSVNNVKSSDGYQYCFSTNAGYFVARSNGRIFITGNSSSLNQIAFNTILLSRDKTNDVENIRNATRVQVVKCRRTGFTGEAGWLRYDPYKSKMTACANPYEEVQEKETVDKDIPVFDSSHSGETIQGEKF